MKKKEIVLELINRNKYLTLEDVAQHLDVSINTARRYVDELSSKGDIIKVKGGSIICNDYKHYKNDKDLLRKQKICKFASSFISNGDSIILDGGTTIRQIIPFLNNKNDLTIFSQGIDILYEVSLLNNPTFTLITDGGTLDYKVNIFFNQDEKFVNNYNFDKGFLSCTAIDLKNGATNIDLISVKHKNTIINNSKNTYFIFDSTKFGKTSLIKICDIEDIENLIVDSEIDKQLIEKFKKQIPNVFIVDC